MIKFKEFLWATKHFCMIVSPISFRLVCNPSGGDLLEGTDVLTLPAGAFSFDMWKLLPEKYFKQHPAFRIGIAYDDKLLADGEKVEFSYSDVDFGTGISGLAGSVESITADINHKLNLLLDDNGLLNQILGQIFNGNMQDYSFRSNIVKLSKFWEGKQYNSIISFVAGFERVFALVGANYSCLIDMSASKTFSSPKNGDVAYTLTLHCLLVKASAGYRLIVRGYDGFGLYYNSDYVLTGHFVFGNVALADNMIDYVGDVFLLTKNIVNDSWTGKHSFSFNYFFSQDNPTVCIVPRFDLMALPPLG